MRILITGYKGFIGQNMVKALADHKLSLYEWGEPDYNLSGLDMVIHLGAISDTRCQDWPALKQQNVDFTTTLMERCQKHGIPLQIASCTMPAASRMFGVKLSTEQSSRFFILATVTLMGCPASATILKFCGDHSMMALSNQPNLSASV